MKPPYDPTALARAILAQPRFHVAAHPLPESWLQLLLGWLGGQWERFWTLLGRHVHLARGPSMVAGDAIVAVLALALLVAIARLIAGIGRDAAGRTQGEALTMRPGARALHVQSLAAAQSGAFSQAIALLFAAALAQLDLRGVLRNDTSATVGDCTRELRRRNRALLAPFAAIAQPFCAVAYGQQQISAREWERAYAAFRSLRSSDGGDA